VGGLSTFANHVNPRVLNQRKGNDVPKPSRLHPSPHFRTAFLYSPPPSSLPLSLSRKKKLTSSWPFLRFFSRSSRVKHGGPNGSLAHVLPLFRYTPTSFSTQLQLIPTTKKSPYINSPSLLLCRSTYPIMRPSRAHALRLVFLVPPRNRGCPPLSQRLFTC